MTPLVFLLVAQVQPATYRLSGDALVLAGAPSGVIALSGDARLSRAVYAEALLWAGANDAEIDALVATITLRHPSGYGELRAGRMLLTTGALLPTHLDGVSGTARAPFGTSLEAFVGVPVVPQLANRSGDWIVGGRIAQRLGRVGSVGVSLGHRVLAGDAAAQTLALDGAVWPHPDVDLAARAAFDLLSGGPSELMFGGGVTYGAVRISAVAQRQDVARLLPATSVFSVLGRVSSNLFQATADWRAAPRLDVSLSGGARHTDGWGEDVALSTTLRLDDRADGAVGLSLTRRAAGSDGWMGARLWLRLPIVSDFVLGTELEIARTEAADVWPWGLASLRWLFAANWDAALALEASATPSLSYRTVVLARVGYRWSGS